MPLPLAQNQPKTSRSLWQTQRKCDFRHNWIRCLRKWIADNRCRSFSVKMPNEMDCSRERQENIFGNSHVRKQLKWIRLEKKPNLWLFNGINEMVLGIRFVTGQWFFIDIFLYLWDFAPWLHLNAMHILHSVGDCDTNWNKFQYRFARNDHIFILFHILICKLQSILFRLVIAWSRFQWIFPVGRIGYWVPD